jgi:23S rRNA (adenine2030-N6)-methyltransferase
MLSYRHGYHAGNFADVLKHTVLALALRALTRKPKPLLYLETHAGAGLYDLGSPQAAQNREYRGGIGRVWRQTQAIPEASPYLEAVRAVNPGAQDLRYYPGSPRVARRQLRPGDRMVLCELHPAEVRRLAAEFAGDRQVSVRAADGYQALSALLPPPERRGLTLIDPAFELRDETARQVAGLVGAVSRFATGCYALWYPIRLRQDVDRLHRAVVDSGIRRVLVAELCVHAEDVPLGLNGSGVLLVNPPWRLDEELGRLLPWLQDRLARQGAGSHRLHWLAGE